MNRVAKAAAGREAPKPPHINLLERVILSEIQAAGTEPQPCDAPPTSHKTRLRIINTSAFAGFNVAFDALHMLITAADATSVVPIKAGNLRINAGQRYDIIPCYDAPLPANFSRASLHRPSQAQAPTYSYLRASFHQDEFFEDSHHPTAVAVLAYQGAKVPARIPAPGKAAEWNPQPTVSNRPRLDLFPNSSYYNPLNIVPLDGSPVPKATRRVVLNIYQVIDPNGVTRLAFQNRTTLLSASDPLIIDSYRANRDYPASVMVEEVRLGEVIQVVINNYDTGEHPMHLHGHHFYLTGAGLPDDGPFSDHSSTPLLTDVALLRDTATINANSSIVFNYVANRPGVWFMHCHIEWHLMSGLGMVWSVGKGTAEAQKCCSSPSVLL
ncbi:MAG: hypothetical protein WDW38_010171 [Sanguina aurantia]